MRQPHRAGEKLFVDYAGQHAQVVDPATGGVREAEVFVAVLGASSYAYCEASWSQALPDWIASHVRALEHFGGCPEILVPDNLKAAVTRAHLYEPDLNPTYMEFARHYGVAVIPARSQHPKDKAKVESGVRLAGMWILARLRKRTFFSLAELNAAIGEQLVATTSARSSSGPARAARCSKSSTGRRCGRCQRSATSSPSGARRARTSITT